MSLPLRYKICRWPQAVKCLSNNSRKLKITISDIFDDSLHGTLLQVVHLDYGTLFAAMIDGSGEIVSNRDPRGVIVSWMTTKQILEQLEKFGFDITYTERLSLNKETLDFLMRIQRLGYDKVTKVVVREPKVYGGYVNVTYPVAIQSAHAMDALTFGKLISYKQFNILRLNNFMYNLATVDSVDKINWDWIDSTYNINDVLADNSDIEEFEIYQGGNKIYPPEFPKPEAVNPDNSDLTPYVEPDDGNGG